MIVTRAVSASQGADELADVEISLAVDGQERHPVAVVLQLLAHAEHRRVLDRRSDDVAAAAVGRRHAVDRRVVALRRAAGEQDLPAQIDPFRVGPARPNDAATVARAWATAWATARAGSYIELGLKYWRVRNGIIDATTSVATSVVALLSA